MPFEGRCHQPQTILEHDIRKTRHAAGRRGHRGPGKVQGATLTPGLGTGVGTGT